MTFGLCERLNFEKNGNKFVDLKNSAKFKISWNYVSSNTCLNKTYFTYKMEISETTENIQFESVEIKTVKSTYSVDPTKPIIIVISSSDTKTVYLKVLWRFIETNKSATDKMKSSIKSNDDPTTEKKLYNFCHRLTIQENGNIIIKSKNGLSFILYWEKSGKTYLRDKISYQMYKLIISEMYKGLEFYDIKLKYQELTYTMSLPYATTVEISETSNMVQLNILWNYKNGFSEENTDGSLFGIERKIKSAQAEMNPIKQNGDKKNLVENEKNVDELHEKTNPQSNRISPSVPIQETTIPENREEKFVAENDFSLSSPLNAAYETKDESVENKIQEQLNSSLQTLADLQRRFTTSADKENKTVPQSTQISPSVPIQEITIPENKEEKVVENVENEFSLPSPLNAAFESKKYSDVIFLTNDSKKVFAHRCILYSFSEIFMAFFDQSSEIPIEIDVDFSETIVNGAIKYCYGKIDGIKNYENDLIKFADKYGIKGLKKACLQSLKDQNLTTENVCEIVKIAFEQNYTLLKEKCIEFIIEKKAELGSEKLSALLGLFPPFLFFFDT